MTLSPQTRRRSLRLKSYDYAQAGAYFITICTQGRECLFGEIVDEKMQLSDAGQMVKRLWDEIPALHPGVETDAFVIMPNHIHGIIVLPGPTPDAFGRDQATTNGATTRVAPTGGGAAPTRVGDVVGAFKSRVTLEYIRGVKIFGWRAFSGRVWQRNYHDRVVRNETSLAQLREYIGNNPLQWALDRENPANPRAKP